MTELMQASRQWATRPPEERFTSLEDMHKVAKAFRANAVTRTVANRDIRCAPVEGDTGAFAVTLTGMPALPNHWAFGQLCGLVNAPAGYLRRLPVPMSADNLNFGLHVERNVTEIGTMVVHNPDGNGPPVLHAATGPNFGRVWNDDILQFILTEFGDGRTGKFTVPGEFGKAVTVDTGNTTLYRSDRDMFVFLADETNRVEIPNRRNGQPGSLARGFFFGNSEVGATSLSVDTFLFDYACSNRIVWGATQHARVSIRHTAGAPSRWLEEVLPALRVYADAETHSIVEAVTMAQAKRISRDGDVVAEFLAKRFNSLATAKAVMLAHEAEEGRPIESVWDAVTGITAYAKGSKFTADRLDIERIGGQVLALAS
jgi:hypothetical protein